MRVAKKTQPTSPAVAKARPRISPPRFRGIYSVKLDHKARFCLPFRFRNVLEANIMIMVVEEEDGKGALFPREIWEEMAARLNGTAEAKFFSCSYEVNLDGKGRVLIPHEALKLSGLNKEQPFLLVGRKDHIEFWSNEAWQKETKGFPESSFNSA